MEAAAPRRAIGEHMDLQMDSWLEAVVASPIFNLTGFAIGGLLLVAITQTIFELDRKREQAELDFTDGMAISRALRRLRQQRLESAEEDEEFSDADYLSEDEDEEEETELDIGDIALAGAAAGLSGAATDTEAGPKAQTQVATRSKRSEPNRRSPRKPGWMSELDDLGLMDLNTSYGSLIQSAIRRGDMKAAEGWMRQGTQAGFEPDSLTFQALVWGWSKKGDVAACERWCEEGNKAGFSNKAMYNNVVRAALQKRDVEAAERWVLKALEAGVKVASKLTLNLRRVKDIESRTCPRSVVRKEVPMDVDILEDAGDDFQRLDVCMDARLAAVTNVKAPDRSPSEIISMYQKVISEAALKGNLAQAESWFQQGMESGADFQPNLKTYTLMVKAASRSGNFRAAEKWFSEALRAGCSPGFEMYQLVIAAAVATGDLQLAETWVRKSAEAGVTPAINVFKWMVALAGKLQKYQECERWFVEAGRARVTANIAIYNEMIAAAGKLKGMTMAEMWFARAVDVGLTPNQGTFVRLIGAAADNRDLPAAERWFERMAEVMWPSPKIYEFLIHVAQKCGDLPAAELWFNRAVEDGRSRPKRRRFELKVATYNAVICVAAEVGRLPDAERWFRKIEAAGLEPDQRSFNTMIRAAAYSGDNTSAESWFTKMCERGMEPDWHTFASMMIAATKEGDLALTKYWFDEIGRAGLKPKPIHFNIITQAAAKAGDLETVSLFRQSGKKAGLFNFRSLSCETVLGADHADKKSKCVTIDGINAALSEVRKRGDLPGAEKLFDRALEQELVPNHVTYSFILSTAAKAGDAAAAETWFRRAARAGLARPGSTTFAELVDLTLANGNFQAAERWVERCRQSGLKPHPVTFKSMIKAYCDASKLELANRYWQECVEAYGPPPLSVWTDIVFATVRSGNMEEAERWMAKAASPAPAGWYFMLVEGHLKSRSREGLDAAERWLQRAVQDLASPPATRKYNAVIRGYARVGDTEGAERVFNRLEGDGVRPDHDSYQGVLDAHVCQGDVEAASQWVDASARARGVAPGSADFAKLLDACAQARPPRPDDAVEIFKGMMSDGIAPTKVVLQKLQAAVGQEKYEEFCAQEPTLAKTAWRWAPRPVSASPGARNSGSARDSRSDRSSSKGSSSTPRRRRERSERSRGPSVGDEVAGRRRAQGQLQRALSEGAGPRTRGR